MIRVLLVDDQKMVRETLKVALAMERDIQVVGTASNGIAAIAQVESLQPDIVIMNMEMPGLDGANTTKQITSRFPNTKVLIHTSYDNDEYVTKSLAMGAKGYLLKNIDTHDLAGVIRNVNKGYTQIAPGLLEKLLITTDSGVVLSKLKNSRSSHFQPSRDTITPITARPQRAISTLQHACRQQQEEINKLRQTVDSNQSELPQIKKNLSRHNRSLWLIFAVWLISLPLFGSFLFSLNHKTNNLQAETSNLKLSTIPRERIGLYGEFNLNGIAQRVAQAFEQDPKLNKISSIYVAQEDDAIVLLGTINDTSLLRRMENIAMKVEGVRKVYSSQVAVEPKFTGNILGSGQ